MSEPIGQTVDGTPWDEPRGPHLPDRLTGIPLLIWPFVVLAVVQVAVLWMEHAADIARDPVWLGQVFLSGVDDVAASLLGAALLLRHPDAIRTLRLVVVGVVLIAVEQVLGLLEAPIRPMMEALTAASEDGSGYFYVSSAYTFAASLVGTFGILYVALGLDTARRYEGRANRAVVGGLVLVSALIVAANIASYVQLPEGSGVIPVLAAGSIVVSFASLLATSYLVVISLGGWRAGESPPLGWALGVASGALTIAAAALVSVALVLRPSDVNVLATAYATLTALAWLALLGAFLVGLPSTAQIEWEAVEVAPTPDPPAATPPGSAGS